MQTQLADIWCRTLEAMEKELPRPSFETWLKNTRPVAFYEDNLVLGVPNEFARNWVEKRYSNLLSRTLRFVTGKDISVRFVIPSHPDAAPAHRELAVTLLDPPVDTKLDRPNPYHLNPKYTFESFVIGNSNRFAHAAALAVAEAPASAYNPLFLYGGVGLGKTHLMQAIGHHVLLSTSPPLRVLYVTSETFTNELINAIRDHTTVEFRARYRTVDVLLIDDIQFIAGKESTQEEFFHTFNALHAANKQIIVTSDRPPKDILTLEERLRSRFEGGLIADIQPPDLETRAAILHKKAATEKLNVPDDVLLFIATKIDTNIRELEGALIRVVAYAGVTGSRLTVEFAHEALRDVIPANRPKPITVDTIKRIVAGHFNINLDDFDVRKRTRTLAFPRQLAMYLTRELTDLSLPQIGELFGGRDHTTVLHAYDKIRADKEKDPSLASLLNDLVTQIKGLA